MATNTSPVFKPALSAAVFGWTINKKPLSTFVETEPHSADIRKRVALPFSKGIGCRNCGHWGM
jgi:hypothetical protein